MNNYIINNKYTIYGSIKPKKLNIDFNIINKEYDGTNKVNILNYNIIGIINNEDINIKSYNAIYNDSKVGLYKDIYINDIILYGINKNNYYINNFITKGNILPKKLESKFIAYNKIYDGTNIANVSGSLKGIILNEDVYIITYNANFINENIGNNKEIIINKIILGGKDCNNYTIENISIIGNIIYK